MVKQPENMGRKDEHKPHRHQYKLLLPNIMGSCRQADGMERQILSFQFTLNLI